MATYNFTEKDIYKIIKYNELDSFSSFYGLKRNYNNDYVYQLKLLDVFINKPNSSYIGLLNSIYRETDIFKVNIGYVTYLPGTTDEQKCNLTFEITHTHIKVYDCLTSEIIYSDSLYYDLPTVLKRNTVYNEYDLCFLPGTLTYGLLCRTSGISDTLPITIPNPFHIGDFITDGTITWEIVKISSPKLLDDIITKFNNFFNTLGYGFNITLYSYVNNIAYPDLYAPYILPITNKINTYTDNLIGGTNYLKQTTSTNKIDIKYICTNSEYFSIYNKLSKKPLSQTLDYNQYSIDYINGILNLYNIDEQLVVYYSYHKTKLDLFYAPIKLFTFNNKEDLDTFLLPMYINDEIVYEEDIDTNTITSTVAYNDYTEITKQLNKKQTDKFPILWNKDNYIYDIIMFEELTNDYNQIICEDLNE